MGYSTPGTPVHHQLPELAPTHVHRVSDAIQPSHPLMHGFNYLLQVLGFPGGSLVKNLLANVEDTEDLGSISGLGRSPGEENGNLPNSCLGNPMDGGAWQAP